MFTNGKNPLRGAGPSSRRSIQAPCRRTSPSWQSFNERAGVGRLRPRSLIARQRSGMKLKGYDLPVLFPIDFIDLLMQMTTAYSTQALRCSSSLTLIQNRRFRYGGMHGFHYRGDLPVSRGAQPLVAERRRCSRQGQFSPGYPE